MDFSVVFLLMPNLNATISEQTGELLKLWLSMLSRIGFQRRKIKGKNHIKVFFKYRFGKKKIDARRQSYYATEISIGQGNVKTEKLFIPCFFPFLCGVFYLNSNLLKHRDLSTG